MSKETVGFKMKKISVITILDKTNQEKRGWLICNTLYRELRKTRYSDKYYRLSVDNGSYDVIRILDYRKSKETETPIKEVVQYINFPQKALVRLRYLQIELIKKGEIDIEYKVDSHQKTISVYVTQ